MVGTRQSALISAQVETTKLISEVPDGGAEAMASRGEVSDADALLDAAAMESGTD